MNRLNNLTEHSPGLSQSLKRGTRLTAQLEDVLPQRYPGNRLNYFIELSHRTNANDATSQMFVEIEFLDLRPQTTSGLAEAIKLPAGISTYASAVLPPNPVLLEPLMYFKNGILVGHTGRRITSTDVANALDEE